MSTTCVVPALPDPTEAREYLDVAAERGAAYAPAVEVRLATELDALRSAVAQVGDAVPERAAPGEVDRWLAAFRSVEGAVAALRTRLVACAQASQARATGGHATSRSYPKEALGVSGREAARQDELARDLQQLPETRAALAAGEIGPEQAQAIGRSARGGALGDARATEEQLLPVARGAGSEELSRAIRRREQEADRASLERAEQRAHRRRRASLVRRGDGMWDLQALLADEHGEALATALDAFRAFDPPDTPISEQRSPQQRTVDALTDLVGAVLRSGVAPTSGGVLPQLNVVVPIEALDPDGAAVGELAHGGVLSPAAIERLLCDANLRRLVTRGDSEVLDVGRSRRAWSVAQRPALRVRDGGCRGPGCDRPPAWTHAHHLVPWEENGPTSVDNGLLLCSFHHHQVHEGGSTVRLDLATAQATFRAPHGRTVITSPPPARRATLDGRLSGWRNGGTGGFRVLGCRRRRRSRRARGSVGVPAADHHRPCTSGCGAKRGNWPWCTRTAWSRVGWGPTGTGSALTLGFRVGVWGGRDAACPACTVDGCARWSASPDRIRCTGPCSTSSTSTIGLCNGRKGDAGAGLWRVCGAQEVPACRWGLMSSTVVGRVAPRCVGVGGRGVAGHAGPAHGPDRPASGGPVGHPRCVDPAAGDEAPPDDGGGAGVRAALTS